MVVAVTLPLPLNAVEELEPAISAENPACASAIEEDDFPFEDFCDIAELESWRKEINRPIYHIHKWWAQRLGSVFRAIVIGALAPAGTNVKNSFYRPVRFPGAVVFDPFMGSGTTLGEALKLGCRVVGRDINPVAHFAVRNAFAVSFPRESSCVSSRRSSTTWLPRFDISTSSPSTRRRVCTEPVLFLGQGP